MTQDPKQYRVPPIKRGDIVRRKWSRDQRLGEVMAVLDRRVAVRWSALDGTKQAVVYSERYADLLIVEASHA